MAPGGVLRPWDGHTYNYAPVNYIQTPYKRTNVFLDGKYALTDNIDFRANIRANFRQSGAGARADAVFDRVGSRPPRVLQRSQLPRHQRGQLLLDPERNAYNATNPATPIPDDRPVINARRRMLEIPRRFEQDVNQFQASFGLNGEFGENMRWEAFYNWGERTRTDQDFGQYSGPGLATALGPSADLE